MMMGLVEEEREALKKGKKEKIKPNWLDVARSEGRSNPRPPNGKIGRRSPNEAGPSRTDQSPQRGLFRT